jgi:hypothetical protein
MDTVAAFVRFVRIELYNIHLVMHRESYDHVRKVEGG